MNHHKHNHAHHHETDINLRFIIAIIVNMIFAGAEFYFAYKYHSASLFADAGHNLVDVCGLLISLTAFLLLLKKPSDRFSFGWKKATILAAFINSVFLMATVFVIFSECISNYISMKESSSYGVMLTAGAGVFINGITVYLLSCGKAHDLNIKGAYLHMLADMLVSIGVIISGALIMLTKQYWLDTATGIIIGLIIMFNTFDLFKESLILLLDGTPKDIKINELRREIMRNENILKINELHIHAVSTTENTCTISVSVKKSAQIPELLKELKKITYKYNLSSSVIELDASSSPV